MLVPGCVSCDILAGKRTEPGGVIYEDDYWHVGTAVSLPVVWRGFLIVKLTPQEAATLGPVIQTTCSALTVVLQPARVYVCSFGDGVRHVHFWVLPRPVTMRPGMHSVILQLDLRTALTRWLGVRRWVVSDEEVTAIAARLRNFLRQA